MKISDIKDWLGPILLVLMGFAILGYLVFAVGNWDIERRQQQYIVVHSQDVGTLVNVSYEAESFFEGAKSRVETTGGIFLVWGTFQASKRNNLTLETYKDMRRSICDKANNVCFPLVN